jgi:hypothetical protein
MLMIDGSYSQSNIQSSGQPLYSFFFSYETCLFCDMCLSLVLKGYELWNGERTGWSRTRGVSWGSIYRYGYVARDGNGLLLS